MDYLNGLETKIVIAGINLFDSTIPLPARVLTLDILVMRFETPTPKKKYTQEMLGATMT